MQKASEKENIFENIGSKIFGNIKKGKLRVKESAGSLEEGSVITPIPPLDPEVFEIIEIYPITRPYTFARIVYNKKEYEYIYEPIEPPLNDATAKLVKDISETLEKTIKYEWFITSVKDKERYLKDSVATFLESRDIKIDSISKQKLMYYIVRNFINYQKIDPLIMDEEIEDISCDGVKVPIYIFHKKYGSIKTALMFKDDNELNSFIVYLGQRCSKQISVSEPILDGTTIEGHRVQATYSREVTTRGGTFTIRRYKERPFTPTDLLKFGTASPDLLAYLWLGVEIGESMIIVGGPAAGKTSTLNVITMFIPPSAKIVSIEDTREINLPHQNWIPGTTRSGTGERSLAGKSAGEIDMYDLVRASLRQRPNYIIVGEVRGKETYTMFQAMATGHTTYSTMHAESVKAMIHRLENPPISCPRILMTALNNVIILTHTKVKDNVVRRIKEVVEIVGFEPETEELITNVVFEWNQKDDTYIYKGHSYLFDKIMALKNWTYDEMEQEFARRTKVLEYIYKKNIADYRDIWAVITNYYKDPLALYDAISKELAEVN
ncbi:MAG: type II/IV secretion system ATPase subunit [Thermoplasmata archaeon]